MSDTCNVASPPGGGKPDSGHGGPVAAAGLVDLVLTRAACRVAVAQNRPVREVLAQFGLTAPLASDGRARP
jgi:hypothetical protein